MKAALELGRWVFLAPIGYLNAPRSTGKSLVHDPARAALVQRAFEEYAIGRFTKEQLLKHVRSWGLMNRRGKPLTSQAMGVLLRNQIYAVIGTGATAPAFSYLREIETENEGLVDQTGVEPVTS